jgi:hypothetical protein
MEDFMEGMPQIGIQINRGPINAFKRVKSLLKVSYTYELVTNPQLEAERIKDCAGAEDFIEGDFTFLEKRRPNYKGK